MTTYGPLVTAGLRHQAEVYCHPRTDAIDGGGLLEDDLPVQVQGGRDAGKRE